MAQYNNSKLESLKNSILAHTKNVYMPPQNIKFIKKETNSCFTINMFTDTKCDIKLSNFMDLNISDNKLMSTQPIDLFFIGTQKEIIDQWFNSCIEAENVAVNFFQKLMKDRIFLIHRRKVLIRIKDNINKEINDVTKLLAEKPTNKEYNKKIVLLKKTLLSVENKLADNLIKYKNAIKNEKIYWLDINIQNLKDYKYDKPTKDQINTLQYWANLDENTIKKADLLIYFKNLKIKLSDENYFENVKKEIDEYESLLKTYEFLNKAKNINSFAKKKLKQDIDKIKSNIAKLRIEYKPFFTSHQIRDLLKDELFEIIDKSQLFGDKKTVIRKHILDESVKQVCTSVNSMLTNYEKNNITSFRLKKRKFNKVSKNMILEKGFFKKNSIFGKIFNDVKCKQDGKYYNMVNLFSIKTSCNLVYNDDTKTYKLFIPEKIEQIECTNVKSFTGDIGLRVFIMGLSENEIIEIGKSSEMNIKNMVKKLRELKEPNYKVRKKKKKIERLRRKIANNVTELHWKIIRFITNNYKTVIIGDINVKSIVRKDGNMSELNKDYTHALSIYKFKQRLGYKCKCMGIKCIFVDEYGTTKLCSNCGHYNDVKDSKTYKCEHCKLKMDRDCNSTRSIKMKAMI